MDFNEYQQLALRTAGTYERPEEQLLNGVLGLCGESGEVADYVKKAKFQGHVFELEKIKNELSDILWYVSLATDAIGEKLDDIAVYNIEKLRKRYPNGFSVEDSIRRVDVEE